MHDDLDAFKLATSILIVDDQQSNILLLREAVKGMAEIHFATDGAAAVQIAVEVRPTLIILDIEMPGMDGFAVMEGLRRHGLLDDTLVMFVTGHMHHELAALEAGGIDFLTKPLDQRIARARIGNLLQLEANRRHLRTTQRDLAAVLHHLPAFVAQFDNSGRNRFCNDAAGAWFGVPAAQMRERTLEQISGSVWDDIKPRLAVARETAEAVNFDLELPGSGVGRTILCHASLVCQREKLEVEAFLLLLTDMTARRRAEMALRDEQERIRITLQSIGDAVIATDTAGCVTYCNPIAESMTGWPDAEARGLPIEHIMPLSIGADAMPIGNPIRVALAERRIVGMAMDCALRRRDGRTFAVEDSAAPIFDHAGEVRGAIIVFHDVSEARAMAVRMTHLANHDALTNLPNRMLLRDRCEQALQNAQLMGTQVALITIDIDGFKAVNARIGYDGGDQLLKMAAERLRKILPGTDTLSHQGGDEFMALMNSVSDVEQVVFFCQQAQDALADAFHLRQQECKVTASMGVAIYPRDSSNLEQLYAHSDSALYRAKQDGCHCWRFFSQEIEDGLHARLALRSAIGTALERGEFEVHYQPKVALGSGAIVGAEALVRWRRSDGTLVGPAEFIEAAEESGQIIALGAHVLEQACRDALGWQRSGRRISLAVNVSPRQLEAADFVHILESILERTGFPPDLLQLEITEGSLVNEMEHHRSTMDLIKARGVLIAIDDFGTGYSSLSYLKRFPVDVMKIDQHFVRNMLHDRNDRAIVAAIVQMAHSLELEVVAEGVEEPAQALALEALGCQVVQGYLYGRPMPLAEFKTRLQWKGRCT